MTVGGPADVRELAHLTIAKVAVDEQMSNNCYLLTCRDDRRPGAHRRRRRGRDAAPPDRRRPASAPSSRPTSTGTTTARWPRSSRPPAPRSSPGAPDADAITTQTGVAVTRGLTQGDTVAVGDCTLEVITIVGHTPGSIALLYDDTAAGGHQHLFTGDSLFPGGVGGTFGDDAAFAQLIDDVETQGLRPAARRRPGSTRATAATRRSASSGRTSASGASAAGRPHRQALDSDPRVPHTPADTPIGAPLRRRGRRRRRGAGVAGVLGHQVDDLAVGEPAAAEVGQLGPVVLHGPRPGQDRVEVALDEAVGRRPTPSARARRARARASSMSSAVAMRGSRSTERRRRASRLRLESGGR